ncbi:WW domain-containing protein [Paramyrothecium foliicola]|nr:WW domain-containing protein [Paramyrothecium foliicola]
MPSSPGEAEPPVEAVPKSPAEAEESVSEKVAVDVDTPSASESPAEDAPPLPEEPAPDGPPLPSEPVPEPTDDGWDCQWDSNTQAWFFHNRFTGKTQWDNPRVPSAPGTTASAAPGAAEVTAQTNAPLPPDSEKPVAGGYNPAIHGDYDPNAWYAQGYNEDEKAADDGAASLDADGAYAATATFNRFTGQFQTADMGPGRHTDDAKSKRQMNAFFDVDAAANSHDGRSLKAERSNKKPSKSELKAFKEKRRARKEEKRRAWLRD